MPDHIQPRQRLRSVALPSLAALVVLFASVPSSAQVADIEETDGPSISLGETDLFPSIRVDVTRDDNVYRVARDEVEANSVVVSPRLLWVADRRLLSLRGTYDGTYSGSDVAVDEYADHRLGLNVMSSPGSRLRAAGSLAYERGHQAFGTDLTRGQGTDLEEPVRFDDLKLETSLRYGADQARGNVSFGLGVIDRNYINLESLTDGFGHVEIEPFGRFSLRVSEDTRALIELRFTDVSFDNDLRSRQDLSLLGGVSFLVTGRSGGELKVGVTQSDFVREEIDDETTLIVEGRFDFTPRDFSRVALLLFREIDNTAGSQVAVSNAEAVRDAVVLNWNYNWSERFSHEVFARFDRVTRGCPERSDATGRAGVELALQIRRWLGFGVRGEVITRSEANCDEVVREANDTLDHDTTRIGLFVRARL